MLSDYINDLNPQERDELERVLEQGERIRWASRPVPKFWQGEYAFLLLFALGWLGAIAFATYDALGKPASLEALADLPLEQLPFVLFLLPFWFIGFLVLSLPWVHLWSQKQTLYLITNRRALVQERRPRSWNTRSFVLEEDMLLSRVSRPHGGGDLLFANGRSLGGSRGNPPRDDGFKNLANLQEAQQQLMAAIADFQALRRSGAPLP